jgi:predicted ribosome quality control (RQC) complex YloA/Tae2 family protein
MTEKLTLTEESARGAQARAILEHDLFKEAVETTQQDIFDKFASLDPSDKDGMQVQRLRLKSLADITRQLQTVMETGRLADEQIKHELGMMERAAERVRRGIRSVF